VNVLTCVSANGFKQITVPGAIWKELRNEPGLRTLNHLERVFMLWTLPETQRAEEKVPRLQLIEDKLNGWNDAHIPCKFLVSRCNSFRGRLYTTSPRPLIPILSKELILSRSHSLFWAPHIS